MIKQTYYEVLGLDMMANSDNVKLAYEQLIQEAKDNLQDSDMFYVKEKSLKQAFQVLSNPKLREEYDNSLIKDSEKEIAVKNNVIDNSNQTSTIGIVIGSTFSKSFIGIVLCLILIWFFTPSGDQMPTNIQSQQLQKQKEEHIALAQKNLEVQTRERQNRLAIERQERLIEIEHERVLSTYEPEIRRDEMMAETRERQAVENAKRQSKALINNLNRATRIQQQNNRLKAGYNN